MSGYPARFFRPPQDYSPLEEFSEEFRREGLIGNGPSIVAEGQSQLLGTQRYELGGDAIAPWLRDDPSSTYIDLVSWPTMPETDGPETMGRVSSENTIVSAEGQPASETTIVDDIITAFNNLQYGPVPGSEDPDELFPSHIPQTREARQRAAALDATLASVSSVQGFFRQCSLPMMDLLPCQMRFDANYKNAFATHLLCNHIQADMRTLRDPFPPLGVRLLLSHSKIRRAENYAWRCPALRCQYWSMSKDAVVGHIPAHGRHNGFEPYRHGWQLKTNPVEIVHDILHA